MLIRKIMRNTLIVIIIFCIFITGLYFYSKKYNLNIFNVSNKEIDPTPKNIIKSLTISAVGDCTIGWDDRYAYVGRFDYYLKNNNNDYSYFFANVRDLFAKDDLTIANLEGTFTDYNVKVEKMYNFKAPSDYVNILLQGNVDIVSVANNHTYDYGEKGYQDTIQTLNDSNLPYYGYDTYLIKEVKGIKIGFFALLDIYAEKYSEVDRALKYLKDNNCDLIIASFHWGIERDYDQKSYQIKMGHYLIDNGVDLVIGHHPHVIEGIEKYKDRYILYSLGNFSFGGNQNPKDKDTYIFRQTFSFMNNELLLDDSIEIIPASVSSVSYANNYQPTILDGVEKDRVMNKILKYSNI